MGTYNMLGLAKRTGAQFLMASTSEVYGDPEVHPQPESYKGSVNSFGVRACYDEGKRISETLCFDYNRIHNVDIKIVRIFNTYGPRMLPNDGRVVSNFIVQALKNEKITLYGGRILGFWSKFCLELFLSTKIVIKGKNLKFYDISIFDYNN